MLAALVGSAIPVNGDWKQPEAGRTIYIYDNGVHTSIILPRNQPEQDLGAMVAAPRLPTAPATELTDDRFPGSRFDYPYLMFGWGDARFYRETPTWGDMRPSAALAALFGSGKTLVHVDRLTSIQSLPASDVKRLVLREGEYAKLLSFIATYFPHQESGGYTSDAGYNADDRFYPVADRKEQLRYSAFFTCNNWVSTALAQAGVKTGYWTPLPFGVMWWFPDSDEAG